MILGIMQPYFFPYLGHFGLIANVDEWVLFDITQYTPKSWMSRNEILKASGGRQRILVELDKRSTSIKTSQAQLLDPHKTRKSLLGSLTHYKKRAPYYPAVVELIQGAFEHLQESSDPNSLVELNRAGLAQVCTYLKLPFKHRVASHLDLSFPPIMGPGDWAPMISSQLGATGYLNPLGGKDLFNPAQWRALGIELLFLKYEGFNYSTPGFQFEPHLSILDVLMWNSPEAIIEHLKMSCTVIIG